MALRFWTAVGFVLTVALAGCEAPSDDPRTAHSGEGSASAGKSAPPKKSAPPAATGAPTPPPEPVPFTDPQTLSATLAAAERALADPDTPAADRDRWAWAQQRAYRDLAGHPDWRKPVRAKVPAKLRAAYDLNLRAITGLFELTDPRSKVPPEWRIERPPPLRELRAHYRAAEREFDVPWRVLASIHFIETKFGRIQGDSHTGAQGPMQFMPKTWDAYGEGDVHDPKDAIRAAARYLADTGAPGDLRRALYAYNHSDHYVNAVLAHAEVMRRYDHYLDAYHRWQVYFRTTRGDVLLKEPS